MWVTEGKCKNNIELVKIRGTDTDKPRSSSPDPINLGRSSVYTLSTLYPQSGSWYALTHVQIEQQGAVPACNGGTSGVRGPFGLPIHAAKHPLCIAHTCQPSAKRGANPAVNG